jgi:hypothetical protein
MSGLANEPVESTPAELQSRSVPRLPGPMLAQRHCLYLALSTQID